jgi:hypothetical protein
MEEFFPLLRENDTSSLSLSLSAALSLSLPPLSPALRLSLTGS